MENRGLQGILVTEGRLKVQVNRQIDLIAKLAGALEASIGWVEDQEQAGALQQIVDQAWAETKGAKV